MNKRIKSLLLCLVMAFTLVATAAPALADSVEPTTLGDSAEAASVTDGTPTDEGTPANDGTPTDEGTPAGDGTPTDGGTPVTDSDTTITPSFPGSTETNIPSYSISFTKTVVKGEDGEVEPGEQDFELEILKFVDENGEAKYPGVSYTATVSTNGAGDYEGKLVITGPESEVCEKLAAEGFCVREKNTGADKWTYDDVVWFVKFEDGENGPSFYPATLTENGYGYDYEADAAAKMTFENTYTENKPVPTATPKPTSPKTGDESAPLLWLVLVLVLGGTAAAGIVIASRKKTER